jgi:Fe2+ transport system protein FeoA
LTNPTEYAIRETGKRRRPRMKFAVRLLAMGIVGGAIGGVLGSAGVPYDTWQFWVVLLMGILVAPVVYLLTSD